MRMSRSGSLTYGRTGRGGFSLVELLVVIGIITVLAGMVLATVGRVRGQADQVKCAAQLHQLGLALAAYANANKGCLPEWSGWHAFPNRSAADDDPGESWTERLVPFHVPPDSPGYTCPSFREPVVTYFLSARWAASQRRRSMKMTEVRLAAQFVLGGETTNLNMFPKPYGRAVGRLSSDCDQDDALARGCSFPGEDGGFLAHKGGNNLLFADLHVQAFRHADPAAMTFAPDRLAAWDKVVPARAAGGL